MLEIWKEWPPFIQVGAIIYAVLLGIAIVLWIKATIRELKGG